MARDDGITWTAEGLPTLMRNLEALPVQLQRKTNKQAVRKAGNITAKDARKRVKGPTKRQREAGEGRTGLLSKSIKVKVTGRAGQPYATAVIGPRTDIKGEGYGGKHVPANIAHLVELGHGGPKPAPPHPFMRPAYDATKDEAQQAIADTLWQGLKAAAVKPG